MNNFGQSGAKPLTFAKRPLESLRGVAIGWRLWRRNSIPQKWIAERLTLRIAANVSQRVRLFDRSVDKELAKDLLAWKSRQAEF